MKPSNVRYLVAAVLVTSLNPAVHASEDPPAEGSLARSLFGPGPLPVNVFGFVQVGASTNSTSTHNAATGGHSNFPVVGPTDEGLQLNAIQLVVERSPKMNLIPRITPLPGPTPQEYSWGFWLEGLYGRNGILAGMAGIEDQWGINRTPQGVTPGTNRQNYLAIPQAYLQFYLPWGHGVAVTAGRFGSGVGYEIGPAFRVERNPFYSRSYAFIAQPDQVAGVLVSANVLRSEQHLAAAEIGVVQGRQNWRDNNNDKSLLGALRWRSGDMATGVDYSFMFGDEQNSPGMTPQMPVARVISPRGQRRSHHSLSVSHRVNPDLKLHAEALVGEQRGDGRADTIDVLTGPGFKGGKYSGATLQAMYQLRPQLTAGARAEYFRNRDGVALFPATAAPGDFTALTVGLRYEPTRYLVLRPELRFDKQSRGGAVRAFGGGNHTSQTTLSMDAILYY